MRQIMRFFKGKTKGPVVAPESVENPPIPYVENGVEVRKNGCDENGEEGPKNGCVENGEEALNALTSKSVENPPKAQVENGEEGKTNGHALTAKSVENSSSSEVEKSEKEKKNGHVASMENQPTPEAKKPAHSESKPTNNGTALNAPVSPPTEKVSGSQDKNEDLLEAAEGLGKPLKPEEELELASELATVYLGRGDEVQPVQRFTVNSFGLKPPQVDPIAEPFGMTVRQLITLTLNDPKFKAELKELITEPPPSDQTDQCNDPCSS